MANLFFSYAHANKRMAERLAGDLRDRGHDVWLDAINLAGGALWEKEIEQAVQACDMTLVLCSKAAAASEWVGREIQMALDHSKPIMPLLLEGEYEAIPLITAFQGVDFRGEYRQAFDILITKLPPASGKSRNLTALIGQTSLTFADLAADWSATLPFVDPVGLFLARSAYCKAYLVGRAEDTLAEPQVVQVALQFSGPTTRPFVEDIAAFLAARKQRMWTVLIQGPINDKGAFELPDEDRDAWNDALNLVRYAVDKGRPKRTRLQFFANAPGALTFVVGSQWRETEPYQVYNLNRKSTEDETRYALVYEYNWVAHS